MDSITAAERIGERGVSSVQFVLASALSLVLFVALANLVVVQYGRGAIRSALEQGARAGSIGGVAACAYTTGEVIADLLGGRMSDDLVLSCEAIGGAVVATASARFEAWTPFMPDYELTMTSGAVAEP